MTQKMRKKYMTINPGRLSLKADNQPPDSSANDTGKNGRVSLWRRSSIRPNVAKTAALSAASAGGANHLHPADAPASPTFFSITA